MASCILRYNSLGRWITYRSQFGINFHQAASKLGKNEAALMSLFYPGQSSTFTSLHRGPIQQSHAQIVTCQNSASPFLQTCPVSWSVIRTYAKKGKDKGGKPHKKVVLTSDQLEGLVDLERVQGDMERVLDDLKEKFIHQVNVRTSQGVFDNLTVKTPDGNFPLIQLGQVVQKSPQLIVLNMAAAPQYIVNVKEALDSSGLNLNPQQDGTSLFLPLPKVTREHREALASNAKMLSEKSKKQLRDIFSRCSKKIKAAKSGHSSDDIKAAVVMVEDMMHDKSHQIESMTTLKQKELMGSK